MVTLRPVRKEKAHTNHSWFESRWESDHYAISNHSWFDPGGNWVKGSAVTEVGGESVVSPETQASPFRLFFGHFAVCMRLGIKVVKARLFVNKTSEVWGKEEQN